MRRVVLLLTLCLAACNSARHPGDDCDPEYKSTESVPFPDGGTCPSRDVVAASLLADNTTLVSVDSDGRVVQQPGLLICCYRDATQLGGPQCYQGATDGGVPCVDAAAAAQVLNVDDSPDASASVTGPVSTSFTPGEVVCEYDVTMYEPLCNGSDLQLVNARGR